MRIWPPHIGLHFAKSRAVWQRLKHPIDRTDIKTIEAQFRES